MTQSLEDYARDTVEALKNAYNNKDRSAVDAVFDGADKSLAESKISVQGRKRFWGLVRVGTEAQAGWLFEKQANSALIALMQAIQQAIAARENK
jgi:hypothetical protein